MTDHDPGDEDRSPDGPWCVRCGDAFEAPERDCPNPAPGRPYVDCGRGGHMFSALEPPGLHLVTPGASMAERRAAFGMTEPSAEERAANLADVIEGRR